MANEPAPIDDWDTSSNTAGGAMTAENSTSTAMSTPASAPEPSNQSGVTSPATGASHDAARTAEPRQEPIPASTSRDEHGRFRPRHRARSQQASPEDVPRIREMTARLKAVEAERDALKARPAPAPQSPAQPAAPPVQPQGQPPQRAQVPPTRPEPTENEIGTKYPTYAAFTRDQALWVHEQERARDRAEQVQEADQKERQSWVTAHVTRETDARSRYPDYDQAVAAAEAHVPAATMPLPEVMKQAILSSDRSADLVYWLATHIPEYQQLIADAWQVNQKNSVGLVRRVLESYLPSVAPQQRTSSEAAGFTGSAPGPSRSQAPRPPNPVRTMPQAPGETPPGDDSSLEDHVKFFHKGLRRGRRV